MKSKRRNVETSKCRNVETSNRPNWGTLRFGLFGFSTFQRFIGGGMLLSGLCLGLLAFGQSRNTNSPTSAGPPEYDLSWYTVDGGGMMFSTGDDYELSGTIGQADAGAMSGAEFELTGGFWFRIPLGDCEDDGDVDLLDYNQLESCLTGPDSPVAIECRCSDVNRSGTVDLLDFAVAQRNFTGS